MVFRQMEISKFDIEIGEKLKKNSARSFSNRKRVEAFSIDVVVIMEENNIENCSI